ncbi:MAG: M23 family peptidase, partial [Azonexus sp.]
MKTLCLALALATPAFALPGNTPVPGGVAVIDLGPASQPAPTARRGEQSLAVVKDSGRWFALFGIPLDTDPGETEISVFSGSTATIRNVAVRGKAYPEQRLTIKD